MRPMTLHAYVGAAKQDGGRTRMGVVFADPQGRTLRKIGRTLPGTTTMSLAVFRGIVCALWNSRRLGARRVVVHCPDLDVAAQINGDREVDEEFVGPYLEVRALLHAYRAARIEPGPATPNEMAWQRIAQSLADAPLDHDVDETVEDLPLWSGLMEERSTA